MTQPGRRCSRYVNVPLSGPTWRLRVSAELDLRPLCPSVVTLNDLVNITFKQQPLPIPTVAVLCQHDNLDGDAIVWLPANTGIPGLAGLQVDERAGANAVTGTVATFANLLGGIMTACDVLEAVGILPSSAPGSAARAEVRRVLSSLRNGPISAAVWCADTIPDFGHIKRDGGQNFNDELSSLLFVSAPRGQHFRMWQHYQYGAWFELQMPEDSSVAGVMTFRNVPDGFAGLANAWFNGGLFDNNTAINDIVTSSRWSRDGSF